MFKQMVDVRCTGAALCRSSGLLQPSYFLMYLIFSYLVIFMKVREFTAVMRYFPSECYIRFFLYYKPLAPVGLLEAGWTCLLPVIL